MKASSREAGAAAELAASSKVVKYAGLSSQGEFVPTASESHGLMHTVALQSLSEMGRRLVETTEDVRTDSFLFQRISVATVRPFNAVPFDDAFVGDNRPNRVHFRKIGRMYFLLICDPPPASLGKKNDDGDGGDDDDDDYYYYYYYNKTAILGLPWCARG